MSKHVFKATRIGWKQEEDIIWFDADVYSREEAEAQLEPYQGHTFDGWPYTGYRFDGVDYHHYEYLGNLEDDEMPEKIEDTEE